MFSGNWQVGRGVKPRPNEANNSPDGIFSKVEGNDNKPFDTILPSLDIAA